MKYTVEEACYDVPVTYPRLMQSTSGGGWPIVLFTDPTEGMKLTDKGFGPSEGNWIPADNLQEWKPFVGTIKVGY